MAELTFDLDRLEEFGATPPHTAEELVRHYLDVIAAHGIATALTDLQLRYEAHVVAIRETDLPVLTFPSTYPEEAA